MVCFQTAFRLVSCIADLLGIDSLSSQSYSLSSCRCRSIMSEFHKQGVLFRRSRSFMNPEKKNPKSKSGALSGQRATMDDHRLSIALPVAFQCRVLVLRNSVSTEPPQRLQRYYSLKVSSTGAIPDCWNSAVWDMSRLFPGQRAGPRRPAPQVMTDHFFANH